jgi:hypothetical protein
MDVEVSCQKCGQRKRLDIGTPARGSLEDYLHLLRERLSHQPSFECFGGHFEFAPPVPRFWEIHWETLQE